MLAASTTFWLLSATVTLSGHRAASSAAVAALRGLHASRRPPVRAPSAGPSTASSLLVGRRAVGAAASAGHGRARDAKHHT
jgi:hypothetical protein